MDELTSHVLGLLDSIDGVTTKRMFSASGLFHHGRMFGLVHDDRFYLRTDAVTLPDFGDADGFTFERAGKTVTTKYREAPAEALDDSDLACTWALRAIASE